METKVCIRCNAEQNIEQFPFRMNHGKRVQVGCCITCFRERDARLHRERRKNRHVIIDLPGEVWEDIPEYDRYQISNKGRIFNKMLGKIVPGGLNDDGYPIIKLTYELYKYDTERIHRIVGKVFLPNPDNLPEINHIDGIKINNDVTNLEWCTRQHNVQHAFDTGLNKAPCGTKQGNAKLTIDQINEIMTLKSEMSYSNIGRKFNVSHSTIREVCLRRTWAHLLTDENGRYYEP